MNRSDEVSLNPQPLPPKAIRVMVSREISYDLAKMQKVTASLLERLGCGGCHSGHMIDFHTITDYVVNPKTLEVQEFTAGLGR